ncbi:MAG: hypothetical protein K6F04_00285 [bacterium]|nr:hypothetical protein [bacterium]
MKLKHLISTSAFILAGIPTNAQGQQSIYMCQSCPAGTYSAGGTSKSCTPCPAGTYSSAGATSCSPCASSTYSSWGGNCGPVTRTRTDYCTVAGSTSSTANPKTVTENGNKGNTCGVGSYCPSGTNKNCTACNSKISHSHYTTKGTCDWACDAGWSYNKYTYPFGCQNKCVRTITSSTCACYCGNYSSTSRTHSYGDGSNCSDEGCKNSTSSAYGGSTSGCSAKVETETRTICD